MSIRTVYSTKDIPDAVEDLVSQCAGMRPRFVIFFASPRYDAAELSSRMRAAFPDACVAGCSTAGEIAGAKMLSDSVSAMFLDDAVVGQTACAVVHNLRQGVSIDGALASLEKQVGVPLESLDISRYAGIVLVDGLSGAEEALLEKIGDRTDLLFVGGSAGDNLKFEKTQVMADGQAWEDAAVLVLLEVKHGFEILKTQSFRATGKTLVATRVDEGRRTVCEFDRQPALDAYARALGVPPEAAAAEFVKHPLGLMDHGDPFVRSPQRVEGREMVFYCRIREGMELDLLEATDIVGQTGRAIAGCKESAAIAGIIDFQCILRTLQLRSEERCGQYGAIFASIPTAGFSTYGEAYLGHMNQTSTMLVFR